MQDTNLVPANPSSDVAGQPDIQPSPPFERKLKALAAVSSADFGRRLLKAHQANEAKIARERALRLATFLAMMANKD
ncbi:MAG: hypothetical protein JNL67_16175 [Planctomycetaceae bacterium]|nr:hypothetical protein [Planctomycetaceae bacterium]